jgi:hypothetical protein
MFGTPPYECRRIEPATNQLFLAAQVRPDELGITIKKHCGGVLRCRVWFGADCGNHDLRRVPHTRQDAVDAVADYHRDLWEGCAQFLGGAFRADADCPKLSSATLRTG